MKSEKAVICKKLTKSYPIPGEVPLVILDNLNWEMDTGALVSICGQSGCGKSTFMNILGLLDRQTSGELYIDGTLFDASRDNRTLATYRAQKIGFVFQQHHLLPELTAIQNIMTSLLIRGVNTTDAKKQAMQMFERLFYKNEISGGVAGRYPDQLSGGQCQRVAIARALVGAPPLVLADEPTGNLDEATAAQVFDLFLNLQKEIGTSVIMVTHNPSQAERADITYKIQNKTISRVV